MSDRRASGFTLFEVLAAVVVLGLTVTILARSAIQGMDYEGDASRRLAASLIADQLLFEVESALAVGNLPELGAREVDNPDDDEFLRVVEVSPLEPAGLGMAELLLPPGAEETGRRRPGAGEALPQLLLVTVRVSWAVGFTEQAVTRTSFAYDATAAIDALATSDAAADDGDALDDDDGGGAADAEARRATTPTPGSEDDKR